MTPKNDDEFLARIGWKTHAHRARERDQEPEMTVNIPIDDVYPAHDRFADDAVERLRAFVVLFESMQTDNERRAALYYLTARRYGNDVGDKVVRLIPLVLFALLLSSPAFAQWTVIDPSNLAKTTIMANQLTDMATRLPGLDRYRTPPPLPQPVFTPRTIEQIVRGELSPYLYRMMSSHMATINTIDAILIRSRSNIDSARMIDMAIGRNVGDLERVVTTIGGRRSLTAVMDSVAASEVMARRQQQIDSSMLTSLVELEAARAERERDAEINVIRARAAWSQPRHYEGDTTGWAKWRQP